MWLKNFFPFQIKYAIFEKLIHIIYHLILVYDVEWLLTNDLEAGI